MPLSLWPGMVDDSGDWISGTVIDKAMFDAIRASVEDWVNSAANPTVKCKTIIDEVVTARGSEASLNTRLSAGLNADGTLILVDATESVGGKLSASAQNVGGIKSFYAHPRFRPGTNTAQFVKVSGPLDSQYTSASNVSTSETDLLTYSIPANVLDTDGKFVEIVAWGNTAANANLKTLKLYFGGTSVTLLSAVAANNVTWYAQGWVVRNTSSSVRLFGRYSDSGGNNTHVTASIGSLSFSGALVVKFTGQSGTASGDITQFAMLTNGIG